LVELVLEVEIIYISELLNCNRALYDLVGFRHVGDLGNVVVTDGQVHTTITDNVISLYGQQTIVNRSIVVCIVAHI